VKDSLYWCGLSPRRDVKATPTREKMILQRGSKGLFIIKKIQNPNPRRGKANYFEEPVLDTLVYQLPRGITLAYDLIFAWKIDRWKGVVKEIHFGVSIKAFYYH
jgi:hypothetical protein